MRTKIKRFLGILIALPILVGLFCGVVEADAAADCDTKTNCETNLAAAQSDYKYLTLLHEAFLDCRGNEYCDDYPGDWWGYTTDKQGTEEECDAIYTTTKYLAEKYYAEGNNVPVTTLNFTALDDINEELKKERKEMGNDITALQIYLHSYEDVNAKYILSITNQKIFSDASVFLGKVIDLLIKMVGVAALVFLVIGGFRLVVAAGNDNEIQKAKSMIQYAVVGLVVALLAYLIVAAVQGILYR